MNIDRAIRNLTAGREDCGMIPEEEYTQTVDLAIEALKRVKDVNDFYGYHFMGFLLGETEG